MNQPIIVIEEVLGRSKQGMTLPFICRGSDGEVYYVKGAGAGRRSQICEWVAMQLGARFGLPIATSILAEVPLELIDSRVRSDIGDLGSGIVFASRELPHVQELTVTTRNLVRPALARDILVFDWWLQNEDRHLTNSGGNPNLLWNVHENTLAVIDHNQAFDRSFDTKNFLQSHVFKSHWNDIFGDYVERKRYHDRMGIVLEGLDDVRDTIPASWWNVDDGVCADVSWEEIVTCLERFQSTKFWDMS